MVFLRFAPLARILDLMNKPQGVTVQELVTELEISERSVYRAFDRLDILNVPYFSEREPDGRRVRYRLDPDFAIQLPSFSLPRFRFSLSELVALWLSCADPGPLSGTDLEKALKTAQAKFAVLLPEALSTSLEKLSNIFVALPEREKVLDGKEELVEKLINAILASRRCRMRYNSFHSGEEKTYILEPLHFFEYQGGLYLFANIPAYDDVRMLAVHRILDVEALDDEYQYPAGFNAKEKLREPFGIIINDPLTVTVRLSPNASRYALEQRFFTTQNMTRHEDGSLTTTFTTSGRRDVLSWVLGSLGDVEVLAPEDLRAEAARLAGNLAGVHGDGEGRGAR